MSILSSHLSLIEKGWAAGDHISAHNNTPDNEGFGQLPNKIKLKRKEYSLKLQ